MFCPPGYEDWSQMRSNVGDLAERAYLADALVILGENPQVALDPAIIPKREISKLREHRFARSRLRLKDLRFEVELISFWLMNRLDEDYGAAICSSAGGLLRANHPILFHPDQFFYFPLSFPLREMSELSRIFEEYDAQRMSGYDLWSRYSCLDGDTGLVKEKNSTKRNFKMYFGDGVGGDGGIFDKFVGPFLGWHLVFDPDVYPEEYYDTFAQMGLLNPHWEQPSDEENSVVKKKRGPKPSPAKQEFFRRYPEGLPEGLTAEAVAEELKASGFPITGRSIYSYDRERRVRK
ncbi:hypothetical protein OL67_000443 [Phaeobacter piscinae]|nr:hypothetical protein OL67_000443 [Phaeobacter piscinae]